jgi:alpha-tubulin suppressor-like RCC1 family protein
MFSGVAVGTASITGGHTCGVTTDDQVYCWGNNGSGQLGNGSTDIAGRPQFAMPLN